MATPIRMKDKAMNKIHLDQSGQMVIAVVKAASDAPSKGVSAQPPNILTPDETKGLPGGVSVSEQAMGSEQGTGAPTERVAPESVTSVQATSAGAMELDVPTAEGSDLADERDSAEAPKTEAAPIPPALGETQPATVTIEAAKDPNAQKEATTIAPNTGDGKIVGETLSK